MLLHQLVPNLGIFEVDLSLDIQIAKNFMDIGNLVLSQQDSIMTVEIASHELLLIAAIFL
jgi:hypothetical protein